MKKEELQQYYLDLAPKKFTNGTLQEVELDGIKRFIELTLIIKDQQVQILVLQGMTLKEAEKAVFPELFAIKEE